jgi:hypothetical protein
VNIFLILNFELYVLEDNIIVNVFLRHHGAHVTNVNVPSFFAEETST